MVKTERMPTGIAGFDSMIEGGFLPKSVNLISGGVGTGKTTFALQFLLHGIEKHKENGVYISLEEEKEQIYRDLLEFGWDLEKYEKAGKFVFLEYNSNQIKRQLTEGGGQIEAAVEKADAKRIVVDSMTALTQIYPDPAAMKAACLALFKYFREWGCTALITSEAAAPYSERDFSSPVEVESDSIILLSNFKERGERQRAIEVLKMRGTGHKQNTVELEITDKGIVVSPNKLVIL